MVEVCVSQNLSIDDGVLGIAPWASPRVVASVRAASTGDGPIDATITLPGKLLIDASTSWTSDSPVDCMVLLRVQRAYRSFLTSNPNAVQIRDRWTSRIGPGVPDVPDVSNVYQSQFGGALDLSSNSVATPITGRMWQYQDTHLTEDWLGPVESGETLTVWYRAYAWTPPPWSDNANLDDPQHEVAVRAVRLVLMAFPQQDQGLQA